MAEQISQDIKELKESLAALAQKQDSQFEELKKLILLNSSTAPRSTTDSQQSAQLSSLGVGSDFKTAEIPCFDVSTEDEHHEHYLAKQRKKDHEHHPAPNSTFIIEEERGPKLPPSHPPIWKYDVFVSFRGKDTRRGFVSHLFQAFKREDVNCYRDVDRNERGQKVDSMLIDAIRHSKMAIILLSQNYADSKWCLQELVEILNWNNQHSIHGHMVLPVFYGVSSDEVKHLEGMVGGAFERCITKNGQHNKDIWENALKQVGRISSWSSNNGDEAYLVQEIVEAILQRVAYSRSPFLRKSSIVPNDSVSQFCSMLDTTSNDVVRTFGICGIEGIGKTTLANAACVHLHNIFEGRVILLEDIHTVKSTQDLLPIQSKMVAELLRDDKRLQLSEDTKKNVLEIRLRLSKKKVLIVLDNVTTLEQVELVLGKDHKYLGLGSRVVITTRDWALLDKLKVEDIYMVPPLSREDSLKLFYHYAFVGGQDVNAIKEYEELSKNIIHYAGGLPPVLESLGHSLSDAPESEWYDKLCDLVRSRCPSKTGWYQYGPFGGRGHVESRWDDGEHSYVTGIELLIVDSVIKSIGVSYHNYGHPLGPLFHGSSNSSTTVSPQKIELDYPYEYLMAISGYIGKTEANEVTVRSLTFHTNTRTFGPFGDESKTGRPFSTQPTGLKIVGFFGSGDTELQYIGVHAKQVSHKYPHQAVGLFGSHPSCFNGLGTWDHGAFTGIKKIIVSLDNNETVATLNCVYDDNGVEQIGRTFIEDTSRFIEDTSIFIEDTSTFIEDTSQYKQVEVTLNYPTEFLLSISGCYQRSNGDSPRHVQSLTFHTNLKTYGPYGSETDFEFGEQLGLSKIVGFFGTQSYSALLEAIGVYLAPCYHVPPPMTIEPLGYVYDETWDDGKHSGVKQIDILCEGDDIFYLGFTYVDGNGGTVQGKHFGDPYYSDFDRHEIVQLDCSKEYLVSISVLLGRIYSRSLTRESRGITSFSFETNLKKYGPYGRVPDKGRKKPLSFSFKSNIAKIVGFHGTYRATFEGDAPAFSIGPHLQLL